LGVRKIFLLSGGSIEIDKSIFLTGKDMGHKLRAPVYSILILHEEGPILIDAGLNPEGITSPEHAWGPRAKVIKPSITQKDTLLSRLNELGLTVSDIKMVILTHLHWDHTGSLRFFENCPIIVQKTEYRFAFHPDSFVAPQYMRDHFDFPLKYQFVEGDGILLPGVSLIKTPGHTPGHQSI
jgi:N-acyl homoserine lactone hydrolase